jgi:hypothetical protein
VQVHQDLGIEGILFVRPVQPDLRDMSFFFVIQRHGSLLAGIGFSRWVFAIPETHESCNDELKLKQTGQPRGRGGNALRNRFFSLADSSFDLKTKLNPEE